MNNEVPPARHTCLFPPRGRDMLIDTECLDDFDRRFGHPRSRRQPDAVTKPSMPEARSTRRSESLRSLDARRTRRCTMPLFRVRSYLELQGTKGQLVLQ